MKGVGKILVSLSLGICVFMTQKNGQRNTVHQIVRKIFFSPLHQEMKEKRERTLEGAVVQKKKPAVFQKPFISCRQNNNNKYNAEEKERGVSM